ncbi:MAG: XRE family transcriptional regulator, partial [Chloroflexales bacterium]|nr:XRE family transcriptional regulator [Chloroflexales bacterium]
QTGSTAGGEFSITVGVPFAAVKWFRGRETALRQSSTCPGEACCHRAAPDLVRRWAKKSWPSAHMHQHVLSALPAGSFPGVDDTEVYSFLEKHAPS